MAEKASKNPQKTILCMLSGGLGSLGALYVLLTDSRYTQFKLHVHHMVLKNVENRALAEKTACSGILAFLRENGFRDFEYTESAHDYSFIKRSNIENSSIVAFMGANMLLNNPGIMMMAIGRTRDDLTTDAKTFRRMNSGQELYHTILPEEIRYQRPYFHPAAHLTLEQIYKMLPSGLRELAWTCLNPRYVDDDIRECGKCAACKRIKQIRAQVQ